MQIFFFFHESVLNAEGCKSVSKPKLLALKREKRDTIVNSGERQENWDTLLKGVKMTEV